MPEASSVRRAEFKAFISRLASSSASEQIPVGSFLGTAKAGKTTAPKVSSESQPATEGQEACPPGPAWTRPWTVSREETPGCAACRHLSGYRLAAREACRTGLGGGKAGLSFLSLDLVQV